MGEGHFVADNRVSRRRRKPRRSRAKGGNKLFCTNVGGTPIPKQGCVSLPSKTLVI